MKIGVLALQGGFAKHMEMIHRIGARPQEVRTESELFVCDGLILPGGESTVMNRLLESQKLLKPLHLFAKERPLFGTCAGLIVMAKHRWLDVTIHRNAYGRQSASFTTVLSKKNQPEKKIEAVFIRAPLIKALYSNEIEILACFKEEPVWIRQNFHMAASFHPELTDDTSLHQEFASLIKLSQKRT